MGKKLWMLCCIMMAMVTAIIVNVPVTEAAGVAIVDDSDVGDETIRYRDLDSEPIEPVAEQRPFKYLIGSYRIARVFQYGDDYDNIIRPEDVDAVIRILCYKDPIGYRGPEEKLCGIFVSAPDDTRLARALEALEEEKEQRNVGDVDTSRFSLVLFDNNISEHYGPNSFAAYVNAVTGLDRKYNAVGCLSGNEIHFYSDIWSDRDGKRVRKERFVLERISQ